MTDKWLLKARERYESIITSPDRELAIKEVCSDWALARAKLEGGVLCECSVSESVEKSCGHE